MISKSDIYLNKIAIITCWYGPYPWYFPYFVISCSYNPTVDFYIITDNQEIILNKPKNLIIVFKTLEEINILFSKKMKKIDKFTWLIILLTSLPPEVF